MHAVTAATATPVQHSPSIIGSGRYDGSYPRRNDRLIQRLENMYAQFDDVDRRLERNEYDRVAPGRNWAPWFNAAARDLDDARREFEYATDRYDRRATSIARSMSDEARRFDGHARQLDRMDRWGRDFGRGWGRVLDNAMSTIDDAISLLRRSY